MLLTTYVPGFDIKAEKDITKSDLVDLCEALNDRIGDQDSKVEPPSKKRRKTSKTTTEKEKKKADFRPQAISEGGIEYCHERENGKQRKSFRIGFNTPYNTRARNWPRLNQETVMTDWQGSTDVIMRRGRCTNTYLKAWEPAPMFTKQELKTICEVFEKHGLTRIGRIPFKYELDHKRKRR
jgi:hypothetical protein